MPTILAAQRPALPVPNRALSAAHWVPAGLLALATALFLARYGVAIPEQLRYAAYVGGWVLLPGMLVYRALSRRRSLVEDVVVGAVVGFGLEQCAFLLLAPLHALAVARAWPLLVLVPFLAFRPLRRHWWVRYPTRMPALWSWAVAVVGAGVLSAMVVQPPQLMGMPASGEKSWVPFVDLTHVLGVAGEAKHRWPLNFPPVAGESVDYHWFASSHMAMASTISGVELPLLLFRLLPVTFGLLLVATAAVCAVRITGERWTGPIAALLAVLTGGLAILPTVGYTPFGAEYGYFFWSSPTHLYVLPFLLVTATLAIELARSATLRRDRGRWLLLCVLAFCTAGAKSSALPVLVAGIGVAAGWELVRRRPWRGVLAPALPLIAMSGLVTVAVYGGGSRISMPNGGYGLRFHGLPEFRVGFAEMLPDAGAAHQAVVIEIAVIGLWILGRLGPLVGMAGLLGRASSLGVRRSILVGAILAGAIAMLLFEHPGGSQVFFLIEAWPLGAIAASWGLVRLWRQIPPRYRGVFIAGPAALVASVLMLAQDPAGLQPGYSGLHSFLVDALQPLWTVLVWGTAAAVAGILIGVLVNLARRRPAGRPAGTALATVGAVVVMTLTGAGLAAVPDDWRVALNHPGGLRAAPYGAPATYEAEYPPVSPQVMAGYTWLRDHSDGDDLVATNAHCVHRGTPCMTTKMTLAAFSERRVLVEGWGYAPRNVGHATVGDPFLWNDFWDPERLRANDVAFTNPSPERLAVLRDTYDVRWLVVDTAYPHSAQLDELLDRSFGNRAIIVYRLR